MNLTPEQLRIVNHVISTDGLTMVSAVAGSGKTSLLVALTTTMVELQPDMVGLYLAYNKSVATEARQKFPSNIKCMTTHSLAFTPTLGDRNSIS